jgi:hypothetical protein
MNLLERAEKWAVIIGTFVGLLGFGALIYSLRESTRTFEVQQRARLFVDIRMDSPEPENLPNQKVSPFIRVSFPVMNTGATPALRAVQFFDIRLEPNRPGRPDWTAIERSIRETTERLKLGPNSLVHLGLIGPSGTGTRAELASPLINISPGFVDEYRQHRRSLWVWSFVRYCDVFGKTHWTQSCFVHSFPDVSNPGGFLYCEDGNETDDGYPSESDNYDCGVKN